MPPPKFKKLNATTSDNNNNDTVVPNNTTTISTKPSISQSTTVLPNPNPTGPRVLYWFRTDLRIHDSPTLDAALALNPSVLIPIWTWDPHYVYRARVGPNRWKFLLESMRVLSERLAELNPRQRLLVVREGPETVIRKLVRAWGVDVLCFEKDTDAYARARDESVVKQMRELSGEMGREVRVLSKVGRTLFDPDELVRLNGRRPTMSMAQVLKASRQIDPGDGGKKGEPRKCVATPLSLPDPLREEELDLSGHQEFWHDVPEKEPDFNEGQRGLGKERDRQYFSVAGPNRDFAIVTLEEMGIDPKDARSPHVGGEKEALRLLKKYIDDEEFIGNFEKPKSSPAAFEPQSTTLLSPHHHFGTLSVRRFWWDIQEVFARRKKAGRHIAGEPENMPGQLLFRDMYFGAQAALGYAFAQTQGNKIARFIDWHLQSNYSKMPVGEHLLDGTYEVDDEVAEERFRRWKDGRTGFPWIDALMRQLKYEGWMHHLGRHSVACFLTRGGCYVSWERGAEVFEEWLVDHETACNVGNWMWLSCTAFYSQFYRCYSPIAFAKKWDPEGHFVRRYVPELKNYDKKYIYEPSKAPIADQKRWGCQITGDGTDKGTEEMAKYPKQMFDFNEMRQFCIDKVKASYDVGLYGDNEKVMSGEWKKVFGHKEGKRDKDEANGEVVRAGKRARPMEEHENDGGGANGHTEDEDMAEQPKKQRKAAKMPSAMKTEKGKQTRIDVMVTRGRPES